MVDSYDVTLVLFDDVTNAKNPVFSFKNERKATDFMETLVYQGYSVYIEVIYD